MAKRNRKNKNRSFKPDKLIIIGSSNTTKIGEFAKFPLSLFNNSKPGGSVLLSKNNNFVTQCVPIQRNSLYLIFLSFNHILKSESQLKTLQIEFQKRVLQTLSTLRSFGLKKEQTIICTPLPRFNQTTWAKQIEEGTKLQHKLKALNWTCVDVYANLHTELTNEHFFCQKRQDFVHYSSATLALVAKLANSAVRQHIANL